MLFSYCKNVKYVIIVTATIILRKKGESMHHKYTEIRIPIEADNPAIQRHEDLCIKCGQCRQVCEREIGVGRLYDLVSTKDKRQSASIAANAPRLSGEFHHRGLRIRRSKRSNQRSG